MGKRYDQRKRKFGVSMGSIAMKLGIAFAEGAVLEALRPRTSGRALDAHVILGQREPTPDYERMRRAVAGEEVEVTVVQVPVFHEV